MLWSTTMVCESMEHRNDVSWSEKQISENFKVKAKNDHTISEIRAPQILYQISS